MDDKGRKVRGMFDAISGKYDFLNHLLSFGVDKRWRKKAIKASRIDEDTVLLDMACGTGDFAITAAKKNPSLIIGSDFAIKMLKLFSKKAPEIRGKLFAAPAELVPLKDESVDVITSAFGVRNFYDIESAFQELARVLKPGGRFTVLEFQLPRSRFVRFIYLLYFRKLLPAAGRLISGHKDAYQYLPDSVDVFDKKVDLPALMKRTGFRNVVKRELTFGVVQLVIGTK